MKTKNGSVKEMGILESKNCPHCGEEVIILYDDF
jgi:predicted RNA-binding Zn-ribbon protein involved in translation (DUF1610 family)